MTKRCTICSSTFFGSFLSFFSAVINMQCCLLGTLEYTRLIELNNLNFESFWLVNLKFWLLLSELSQLFEWSFSLVIEFIECQDFNIFCIAKKIMFNLSQPKINYLYSIYLSNFRTSIHSKLFSINYFPHTIHIYSRVCSKLSAYQKHNLLNKW